MGGGCASGRIFRVSLSLMKSVCDDDDTIFLRDKAEWTNLCVAFAICLAVPTSRGEALVNQFESFDDLTSRMRTLCSAKPLFECLRTVGEYSQERMADLAAGFISMAVRYCCEHVAGGHGDAVRHAIGDALGALWPLMGENAANMILDSCTSTPGYVFPSFKRLCSDDDASAFVCELLIERGDYPDHIAVVADALSSSGSELHSLQQYAEAYDRIESVEVLKSRCARWAIVVR